jgi:glycosyltransferase involved in cell wall biosynthesis
MPADPRVSVVVPVRDGARYLEEALRSIAGQKPLPLEVVVVDDGSRDESARIAEQLGARVIRQDHAGQAAARNRGLEESRAELVAFLDADDIWPSERLDHAAAALDSEPGVDLVFGHVREFVSPDLAPAAAARLRPARDPTPARLPGTMLARRSALERVGPFSTEWQVGELMEWLLRAREAGLRESMLGEVVLLRRLHHSNTGRLRWDERGDHARILKQALDRARARQAD